MLILSALLIVGMGIKHTQDGSSWVWRKNSSQTFYNNSDTCHLKFIPFICILFSILQKAEIKKTLIHFKFEPLILTGTSQLFIKQTLAIRFFYIVTVSILIKNNLGNSISRSHSNFKVGPFSHWVVFDTVRDKSSYRSQLS